MDRAAHARAARRRQAEDALTSERDREAMLTAEVEDLLAEEDGAEIDSAVFAAMTPEDVALVRAVLGSREDVDDVDDWEEAYDREEPDDADAGEEDELARLQGEIESSRRSQAALERYLELL